MTSPTPSALIQSSNDTVATAIKSFDTLASAQAKVLSHFATSIKRRDVSEVISSFEVMTRFGRGWSRTSRASRFKFGEILYVIREAWDSGALPDTIKSGFEGSFERFIQETYMLSPRTANAYAARWFVFLSGKSGLVIPSGIDIYSLSDGRLDAIVDIVLSGEKIKASYWPILCDEGLTNTQVYSQLFGSKTRKGKSKKDHIQLISKTGTLRILTKAGIVDIGFLNYRSKDEHVRALVTQLIEKLGAEIVA